VICVCAFIIQAVQLSNAQLADLKTAFRMFDQDGNGKIDLKELEAVTKALCQPQTKVQLEKMLAKADKDKSGAIEFNEFVQMMTHQEPDSEREIRAAFRVFDKDGSGFITPDELRSVMEGLGQRTSQSEVQKMIQRYDKDGDGRINYDEFVTMMTS